MEASERRGEIDRLARETGSLAILTALWPEAAEEGGGRTRERSLSLVCEITGFLRRFAAERPSEEQLDRMGDLERLDAIKTSRTPTAAALLGVSAEPWRLPADREMIREARAAAREAGLGALRFGPSSRMASLGRYWRVHEGGEAPARMEFDARFEETIGEEAARRLLEGWARRCGAEPIGWGGWGEEQEERALEALRKAKADRDALRAAEQPERKAAPRGPR